MKPRHLTLLSSLIILIAGLLSWLLFDRGSYTGGVSPGPSDRVAAGIDEDGRPARPVNSHGASPLRSVIESQTVSPRHPHDTEPPERWWMNKSPAVRAKLTQPPPEWLKIGGPCAVRTGGDPKDTAWTRFIVTDSTKHAGLLPKSERSPAVEIISRRENGEVTIRSYGPGMIAIPQPLGEQLKGSPALVNNGRSLALVRTQVYSIVDSSLVPESGKPVPELNYDDSRRSTVTWQTWMSDTMLLGMMAEEAVEEFPVRAALYIYDVVAKEMKRISLPEPVTAAYMEGSPTIQIVAVNHDSILVTVGGWGSTGKDFVLTLEP